MKPLVCCCSPAVMQQARAGRAWWVAYDTGQGRRALRQAPVHMCHSTHLLLPRRLQPHLQPAAGSAARGLRPRASPPRPRGWPQQRQRRVSPKRSRCCCAGSPCCWQPCATAPCCRRQRAPGAAGAAASERWPLVALLVALLVVLLPARCPLPALALRNHSCLLMQRPLRRCWRRWPRCCQPPPQMRR